MLLLGLGHPRSEAMKTGYVAEIDLFQQKLLDAKADLESFYAKRHEDIEGDEALKQELGALHAAADLAIQGFTSGTRIVKSALAPCFN